jgi:hypothetical protein
LTHTKTPDIVLKGDYMKRLLKQLLSLLPTKLPVGMTEFNAWADSIIELSGNYADADSMKFALASMVIHLGPQRSSVAKNHFVRSLRKTAANQVAQAVFQDIKIKQQEAAKAAQQAEATALQEATNSGKEDAPKAGL